MGSQRVGYDLAAEQQQYPSPAFSGILVLHKNLVFL